MASAWLIRRFIDRKAKFLWLDNPKKCPKSALGFDFDGAAFTHVGGRVSFEVLAASFGLESDPALARIAGHRALPRRRRCAGGRGGGHRGLADGPARGCGRQCATG
jgi:hypothetical protein